MKFMLDTNAVIAVQRLANERFIKKLRRQRLADVVISAVTLQELYYGVYKSRYQQANLANVEALRFTVLPFGDDAARHAGQIRAALYQQPAAPHQQPIAPYDAMIAGHARAAGLILVSHNTREFSRVPELRLQDWES